MWRGIKIKKLFKLRGKLVINLAFLGAWIITGGMASGVMKLVGKAVRDYYIQNPEKEDLVALGIASWGFTAERNSIKRSWVRLPLHAKHRHTHYDTLIGTWSDILLLLPLSNLFSLSCKCNYFLLHNRTKYLSQISMCVCVCVWGVCWRISFERVTGGGGGGGGIILTIV